MSPIILMPILPWYITFLLIFILLYLYLLKTPSMDFQIYRKFFLSWSEGTEMEEFAPLSLSQDVVRLLELVNFILRAVFLLLFFCKKCSTYRNGPFKLDIKLFEPYLPSSPLPHSVWYSTLFRIIVFKDF